MVAFSVALISVFIRVNSWLIFLRLSRRSLGEGGCLRVFVAENQLAAAKPFGEDGSIKNNKLCKTNPILSPLHLSRALYKFTPFYAKQTQFKKCQNKCNLIKNNDLQRKMNNGHLVKTNPIKPNLCHRYQTRFPVFPFCNTTRNGVPPIMLVFLNWLYIISFSVMAA